MNALKLSFDRTPPADYDPPADGLPFDPTLTQIADYFGTDKGSLDHRYTEIYERVLCPQMVEPINLLEIGVACGASLKMWSRWLPNAQVTGVDIRPECATLCAGWPNIRVVTADATKTATPGAWDIIIDDGSHLSGHIVKAFRLHWPLLRPGGTYVVEDTKCTHKPGYSVPFPVDPADKDRAHFMGLVDQLLRSCDRGGEVESVQFWKELCVVRKRG